jgi:uncharacterized protein (DUF4415 family)
MSSGRSEIHNGNPETADTRWLDAAERAKAGAEAMTPDEEASIQAGIAADPDSPEWTEADFARARPASEALPHIVDAWRRSRGRPKSDTPKTQVTLRLSQEVLEHFKAGGPGWQTRIDETLKKAIGS